MKKNTRSFLAFIIIILSSSAVIAQPANDIDWKAPVKLHTVPPEFAKYPAVIILQDVKVGYRQENDDIPVYRTIHRIIKVLDNKGIESFDKVVVPMYAGEKPIEIKARTIVADGKTYDITPDKIKEEKEENGALRYSFAMEGVEIGSEIELLITYKKPFALFGDELMQYDVPILNATFEMSSPVSLKFEEKGYNGIPTIQDTIIYNLRYIKLSKSNIPPAVTNEDFSFPELYKMKLEYKLSYLPEKNENVRVYTWKDLVKKMYDRAYTFDDNEKKAVEKYLVQLGVNNTDSEQVKIEKIEAGIKNSIVYYKDMNDEDEGALNIETIISKKSANKHGLNHLFAACFIQAGVKHELGLVPAQSEHRFDNAFENWDNMDNYLFYFPDLKTFLYPIGMLYRYPFLPASLINSTGVFCRRVSIGSFTNAVVDIQTTKPMPVKESYENITAAIRFDNNMDATTSITYSFAGYPSVSIRDAVLELPKEKQKDFVMNIIGVADNKPDNLISYKIANETLESAYADKPIEINAEVKTSQLVERAGSKYLLKIGDVIGKQDELYQMEERKLPVDIYYPHTMTRVICMAIPDGYKILNPEAIKIDISDKDENGNETAAFHSDYKLKDNKLTVTINEFYAVLHYPVSGYEAFRKVINASADFNKVILLMENKKG